MTFLTATLFCKKKIVIKVLRTDQEPKESKEPKDEEIRELESDPTLPATLDIIISFSKISIINITGFMLI